MLFSEEKNVEVITSITFSNWFGRYVGWAMFYADDYGGFIVLPTTFVRFFFSRDKTHQPSYL